MDFDLCAPVLVMRAFLRADFQCLSVLVVAQTSLHVNQGGVMEIWD